MAKKSERKEKEKIERKKRIRMEKRHPNLGGEQVTEKERERREVEREEGERVEE